MLAHLMRLVNIPAYSRSIKARKILYDLNMRGLGNKAGLQASSLDINKVYEEAVRVLNTMQSNAAVLEKMRQERSEQMRKQSILDMKKFSARAGIGLKELDNLSMIHVSGTKGKGSTCAFTESILRSHGFKTGFYSSPHLVEVRERIRINGKPLAKEAFSRYFWDIYRRLETEKESEGMPGYFRFLTIMAFHVFMQEKVDVAIIEVGIGGQYDCTNIIRSPVVCGVTSLGLDHTSILGKTIEEIAWNKGGIFKPGVPAISIQQPAGAMRVLINRARELQAPLYVAPDLACYPWPGHLEKRLGITGHVQNINASLAVQLSQTWLRDHKKKIETRKEEHLSKLNDDIELNDCDIFPVSIPTQEGLRNCRLPGRSQLVYRKAATYYLDGAHTEKSLKTCMAWFSETSKAERKEKRALKFARVLMFNVTGDRDAKTLLTAVLKENFDCAIFVPNIATMSTDRADQTNFTITLEGQLARSISNKNIWMDLLKSSRYPTDKGSSGSHPDEDICPSFTFNCIKDALAWLSHGTDQMLSPMSALSEAIQLPPTVRSADHIQILCTGSMHLVGGCLGLIEPEMNEHAT